MTRILVQISKEVVVRIKSITYMRKVKIVSNPPSVVSLAKVDRIISWHVSARSIFAFPIPLLSTPLFQRPESPKVGDVAIWLLAIRLDSNGWVA